MELFLEKLCWQMPLVEEGSAAHIGILLLTIAAVILEARILEKTPFNRGKLLQMVGICLLILEIMKQIFLNYLRGWDYSWSDLPLQLCSIPMYLALIAPYLKPKAQRTAEDFLMTFGMLGGAAALIKPVGLFSEFVLLTAHSLLWHELLIFMAVAVCADRKKELLRLPERGHLPADSTTDQPRLSAKTLFAAYRRVGRLYLILAVCAVILNACLMGISEGTANLFFLGPSFPDMILLNEIYIRCGWIVETILFIAVTWIAGLVVYLGLAVFWNPGWGSCVIRTIRAHGKLIRRVLLIILLIFVLLAVIFLGWLLLVPRSGNVKGQPDQAGYEDGWEYWYRETSGTCSVVSWQWDGDASNTTIVIPEEIGGRRVTSLSSNHWTISPFHVQLPADLELSGDGVFATYDEECIDPGDDYVTYHFDIIIGDNITDYCVMDEWVGTMSGGETDDVVYKLEYSIIQE